MDTRAARYAVSALFMLDGAVLGGWLAHIADAQQQHHLSKAALGLLLLSSPVGAVLTIPFSGTLIHRYGSRTISLVTAPILLLAVPFLMAHQTVAALALNLIVMGAANSLLDVSMNAHSVAVQRQFDRPILSAVHGWFCVGGFAAGGLTAGANALKISPTVHLTLASALLAIVLIWLAPRMLPGHVDQGEEGAKFVLPSGRLLTIGLLVLVAFITEGALWEWSTVYLRTELRTTAAIASLAYGLGAGAMALARLFGDPFVASVGSAQTMRISGLLTAGGLLLAVAIPHPATAIIGFMLGGIGLANAVPILFGAAGSIPGVSSGAGLAAVTYLGYTSFLGGPPLIGFIGEVASLRLGLALFGLLAISIALAGPRAVDANDTTRT